MFVVCCCLLLCVDCFDSIVLCSDAILEAVAKWQKNHEPSQYANIFLPVKVCFSPFAFTVTFAVVPCKS